MILKAIIVHDPDNDSFPIVRVYLKGEYKFYITGEDLEKIYTQYSQQLNTRSLYEDWEVEVR